MLVTQLLARVLCSLPWKVNWGKPRRVPQPQRKLGRLGFRAPQPQHRVQRKLGRLD